MTRTILQIAISFFAIVGTVALLIAPAVVLHFVFYVSWIWSVPLILIELIVIALIWGYALMWIGFDFDNEDMF